MQVLVGGLEYSELILWTGTLTGKQVTKLGGILLENWVLSYKHDKTIIMFV